MLLHLTVAANVAGRPDRVDLGLGGRCSHVITAAEGDRAASGAENQMVRAEHQDPDGNLPVARSECGPEEGR